MLHKILAVDNDSEDLFVTETILSRDVDLQIQTEGDPETAIKIIKLNPFKFSVIILDYHMERNGLTVAQEMFSINPKLQIVILSSDQSREVLKKSIQVGVKSYIDKEEDGEVLLAVVKSLCQKWQNKTQVLEYSPDNGNSNETLISSIGLIGRSQKLAEVAKLVKRAAKVDCSVVIQGESGTGKELIAKAVHEQSKRKSKPFVAINVNAIAQNLTESELFGHVKGAFTGADKDSPGKILSAQGGTLFLDEIGDLKPEIQVKLLRVLQERKLSPVGSNRVYD
ncbi:MAG: sigma-54-dependent transcriptional regulator, partial [Pseudobdellovibrionaceae bacterium]